MKKIFCMGLLLVSMSAMATPQKIIMVFMSPPKNAEILELIKKSRGGTLKLYAQNYQDNCVPMGDGCFHPQFGYLNKKPVLSSAPAIVEEPDTNERKTLVGSDPELQLKTFNATETSLVNCEKGNYFDIFCGKAKAQGKFAEVEIWFDVSSSLRAIDYNKDPDFCNRRTFYTKIQESCKEKVSASIYNTSLKQVGDSSSVCLSYGGNEESKLLKWMKDSEAKTLIVVTDIDEMSKEMRDFLDSHGAKYVGDSVKPFTSADLVDYAKEIAKTCKK